MSARWKIKASGSPVDWGCWALLVSIFLAHQMAQKVFNWPLPFLDQYLDPFLSMPILLGLWQFERRLWWHTPDLDFWDIALATAFLIGLFEWGFPQWSSGFTADWKDAIAYCLGSICFLLWYWAKQQSVH
ncbi:MAG TPA: hypothetical protein PKA00_04300 [Saprospiraceae bacterium]|nr:hypothetical protein [Saprospiraceae bacterium]HMQ82100.1 hypothetical protein [Saprospiraceae bacterium]